MYGGCTVSSPAPFQVSNRHSDNHSHGRLAVSCCHPVNIRAEEAKHKFKIFLIEFRIHFVHFASCAALRESPKRCTGHGKCLMSRREFDPATDSEADGKEEELAHHSAESGDDDELENEEETTGGKKKRAKLALKDFVEV